MQTFRDGLAACIAVLLCASASRPVQARPAAILAAGPACSPSPVVSVDALGIEPNAPAYIVSEKQLYRMTDAAAGWVPRNPHASTIQALAPDRRSADALTYATNEGVYRSTDGGLTGLRVSAVPDSLLNVLLRTPSAPDTLYGLAREDDGDKHPSAIFRSDDNGATWTKLLDAGFGPQFPSSISDLSVDPHDARHLLAIESAYHGGTIIASSDGGAHWQNRTFGAADAQFLAPGDLRLGPGTAEVWATFQSWNDGKLNWLAHSIDGGTHWQRVAAGLPPARRFSDLAVDAGGAVYVEVDGPASGKPNSIFVSVDGAHFRPLLPEGTLGVGHRLAAYGTRLFTWDDFDAEVPFWSIDTARPAALQPLPAPAAGGSPTRYFPVTQHAISGPFLAFFDRNGGMATLGLPLSEAFIDGGKRVQYFERALLILAGGTVTPAPLGRLLCAGRVFPPATAAGGANARVFPETGHTLSGRFLTYWQQHHGSLLLGPPISEPLRESNGDDSGRIYAVQYFANGRLEDHKELQGTRYQLQMGLLGREYLHQRGWL